MMNEPAVGGRFTSSKRVLDVIQHPPVRLGD
jgi:hypothetical protein